MHSFLDVPVVVLQSCSALLYCNTVNGLLHLHRNTSTVSFCSITRHSDSSLDLSGSSDPTSGTWDDIICLHRAFNLHVQMLPNLTVRFFTFPVYEIWASQTDICLQNVSKFKLQKDSSDIMCLSVTGMEPHNHCIYSYMLFKPPQRVNAHVHLALSSCAAHVRLQITKCQVPDRCRAFGVSQWSRVRFYRVQSESESIGGHKTIRLCFHSSETQFKSNINMTSGSKELCRCYRPIFQMIESSIFCHSEGRSVCIIPGFVVKTFRWNSVWERYFCCGTSIIIWVWIQVHICCYCMAHSSSQSVMEEETHAHNCCSELRLEWTTNKNYLLLPPCDQCTHSCDKGLNMQHIPSY